MLYRTAGGSDVQGRWERRKGRALGHAGVTRHLRGGFNINMEDRRKGGSQEHREGEKERGQEWMCAEKRGGGVEPSKRSKID